MASPTLWKARAKATKGSPIIVAQFCDSEAACAWINGYGGRRFHIVRLEWNTLKIWSKASGATFPTPARAEDILTQKLKKQRSRSERDLKLIEEG